MVVCLFASYPYHPFLPFSEYSPTFLLIVFEKLKNMYSQLIELVSTAKESDIMDEKLACFFKMFQIVRAWLESSPYTHFYTQVLIDIKVSNKLKDQYNDNQIVEFRIELQRLSNLYWK